MLDFGFSEILLTSAIALVVLGPERLPKVARQVGNWMGRARAMARQLTEQLEREVNAEELLRDQAKPKPAMTRLDSPTYVSPDPYAPPTEAQPAAVDNHSPVVDTHSPGVDAPLPVADAHSSPAGPHATAAEEHAPTMPESPVGPSIAPPHSPMAAADGHAAHGADTVKSPND
jgi:sec-independent protein translocase protein TatB